MLTFFETEIRQDYNLKKISHHNQSIIFNLFFYFTSFLLLISIVKGICVSKI